MLDDAYEIPIICPECGYEMKKKVGWLKNNMRFRCERCSTNLWTHEETLADVLDKAEGALNAFLRNSRFFNKGT